MFLIRRGKKGPGHLEFRGENVDADTLKITFKGRLDTESTAAIWRSAVEMIAREKPQRLVIEAKGIEYCDGTGIGLLVTLECRQKRAGRDFHIENLAPRFQQLFDLFDPDLLPEPSTETPIPVSFPEEVGRGSARIWEGIRNLISFVGELTVSLFVALSNPRRIRWGDLMIQAEKVGANGLPVVLLVSFLVGLIMAFQAAIPMREFGAEIYVADLIGLSMLRELGPLMTAMVLAGRSGSAFAAELGTMKVNEEIDALQTMGIDPIRHLVVIRVLAAMLMVPLLTLFADLVGIMGGSVVLLSLGYPLIAYIKQLLAAVAWMDMAGGLVKSVFFGVIVAGIGCLHGLQTRAGASAVGDSATRAVVSGNVLIIIADGVFSVLFFYLGV